jgi:hypothetical protein
MVTETEINKLETEAETIWDDIKLDAKKVIAILRAHLGGDHPAIHDLKKLATASTGEPISATPSVQGSIASPLESSASSIPAPSGTSV